MRITFTFIVALFIFFSSNAQKPFANEIEAFKKQDSIQFPGTGKILFIGSSSFRLWKDLQADFPKHDLINRGFGGSTIADLLLYKENIVAPYKPRQVLIYCGENDIAGGTSPEKVFSNFKEFFSYIRALSPDTHIAFVAMKPSPSRDKFLSNVKEGNKLISDFLATQERAVYIDIFTPMLNKDGSYREELFVEDRLHMNRKGYDIWKKAIGPHLK